MNSAIANTLKDEENSVPQMECLGSVLMEMIGIMEQHQEEKNFFDSLDPSCQRSYIEWIGSAKLEKTKNKRLSVMVEKLRARYKTPYEK